MGLMRCCGYERDLDRHEDCPFCNGGSDGSSDGCHENSTTATEAVPMPAGFHANVTHPESNAAFVGIPGQAGNCRVAG
jgi:hypothetical protein